MIAARRNSARVMRVAGVVLSAMLACAADAAEEKIFARVGSEVINAAAWEEYATAAARGQFYHGHGATNKQAEWRRQTAQTLIDETLSVQEARRRGLQPAPKAENSGAAQNDRTLWVAALKNDLARELGAAREETVRAYYEQHADKFTTPEQLRVSVVLLSVPPYAPSSEWQQTLEKARALYARIKSGERFEEVARANSMHESAARGGDLGLVHRGVLSRELQEIADTLQLGETAEPRMILRGVVIVRLEEKQPAERLPFERARERAAKLFEQERDEQAWRDLIGKLRAETHIELNDGAL